MNIIVNKTEFEAKRIETKNGMFIYSKKNIYNKVNSTFISNTLTKVCADFLTDIFNEENKQLQFIY